MPFLFYQYKLLNAIAVSFIFFFRMLFCLPFQCFTL